MPPLDYQAYVRLEVIGVNDVWLLESGSSSHSWHWDGEEWTMDSVPGFAIQDIGGTSDGHVWAVGHTVGPNGYFETLILNYSLACEVTGNTFADVPEDNPFYPYIRHLAEKDILKGYNCGNWSEECDEQNRPYFRPNNSITRGQIAKVVSLSALFTEEVNTQHFEDVAPGSPFYPFIERLASRHIMGGYPCGGHNEPCGTDNKPYFRPGALTSRAQLTKLVANAAGFTEDPGVRIFEDVPEDSPFYEYIQRLAKRQVITGYACGEERPCIAPENRPYFLPGASVTRGQASKIIAKSFFPSIDNP